MPTKPHLANPSALHDDIDVERLPIPRLLLLHLLPGALAATAFYLTGPVVIRAGYPGIVAGIVAAGLVVVLGELGWLLREARRGTGTWSLVSVLPYRPGPFNWRKSLLVLGLFGWAFLVSAFSLTGSIKDVFFSWVPDWALNPLAGSFLDTGSSNAKALTAIGYLLFLVLLGPLVEELYFRGYLLPRLTRFGAWAPLINVTMFAAYHMWKPWDLVTLVLTLAPMVYAVWRLRDIRIGIAVHIALNGFGWATNVAPNLLLS